MPHRIQELCSKLLEATQPEQVKPLAEQLQAAIHEHIENLRENVAGLSVLLSEDSKKIAEASPQR